MKSIITRTPDDSQVIVTDITATRVISAGGASMILTVGIARFLFTPLLPIMQSQTWLTMVAGGWLATINYVGFLAGVLIAASVGDLRSKFVAYRAGLIIAVVSTVGMGLTESFPVWAVLRFIAGMSSITGMLLGSGLVLHWLRHHGRRLELGIHFGGIGLGVVVSGLLAIAMARSLDWSQQWLAAGVIGVLFLIPAWFWLPEPPKNCSTNSGTVQDHPPTQRWFTLFSLAYFCAGVGYVVSATFIVAIAAHQPHLRGHGNLIWVMVGIAAMPACFLWDRLVRATSDIPALIAAFAIQSLAILLSAFASGLVVSLVCAALFGGSWVGIVSMTLSTIGRFYPSNPAKAMARMTISFGVANILAPAISGYIAAFTGSYRDALVMAGVMMMVGIVLLTRLHSVGRRVHGLA